MPPRGPEEQPVLRMTEEAGSSSPLNPQIKFRALFEDRATQLGETHGNGGPLIRAETMRKGWKKKPSPMWKEQSLAVSEDELVDLLARHNNRKGALSGCKSFPESVSCLSPHAQEN